MKTPSFVPKLTHLPETHHRDFFEWTDFYVKTIGTMLAVIAILQTAQTYRHDSATRVLDEKAKVLDQALDATQHLIEAQEFKSFRAAFDHYGLVKHGPVMATFGEESEPYLKMVDLWNFYFVINEKHWPNRDRNEIERLYEAIVMAFRCRA